MQNIAPDIAMIRLNSCAAVFAAVSLVSVLINLVICCAYPLAARVMFFILFSVLIGSVFL